MKKSYTQSKNLNNVIFEWLWKTDYNIEDGGNWNDTTTGLASLRLHFNVSET